MQRRSSVAVLDAAEALLARGELTIDALAAEAGVALGTIYSGFGSKDGVLAAVAERLVTRNEEALAAARAAASGPLDEVIAMTDAYLAFHRAHPIAFRLLGRAQDPALEARLDAMVRQVADALRRAVAAGEADVEDPLRTARFAWAAYNGVLAMHARGSLSERELRATLRAGRAVLLGGLAPG